MLGSYPKEFRDGVVRVARDSRPAEKVAQIVKDFGISESRLTNWLRQADIEDGNCSGATREDAAELREACNRIRPLKQENKVFLRATAYLSQANVP